MTSTPFNIGLNDGRNSSRVLRPPGGGHTDVLGLGPDPAPVPQKKGNPRNISSISEGTSGPATAKATTPEMPTPAATAPVQETVNSSPAPAPAPVVGSDAGSEPVKTVTPTTTPTSEISTNGTAAKSDSVPVSKLAPAPACQLPQQQQRVRVPPGGFSSGLW